MRLSVLSIAKGNKEAHQHAFFAQSDYYRLFRCLDEEIHFIFKFKIFQTPAGLYGFSDCFQVILGRQFLGTSPIIIIF